MVKYYVLVFLFFFSCAGTKKMSQGIRGQVVWFEGNRMPGTGQVAAQGVPIARTVYIYELTNRDKASTKNGIFYHDIHSGIIKKIHTNPSGKFALALPEGKYSVFVKEKDGLFANILDGNGNINPVEVKKGSITEFQIRINYRATY